MNAAVRWAGVAGLGAGVMYLLDPDRGRRRRAFIRDKGSRFVNQSGDVAGKTWRDVSNRAQGLYATGRRFVRREGLQHAGSHEASRGEVMQKNWSPAVRAMAGAAGASLVGLAIKSRSLPWLAAGAVGGGLLARAISNKEMKTIVGLGGRRAVDLQKTIHINAPVEEVYRFWSDYENFPRFMRHIREVRDLGNGVSHWVAAGPAGVPVSWDAEITERIPNRVLAWKSAPGSTVGNAGIIRFDSEGGNRTRLTVRLSYNPPAGEAGHVVASLFGADPKTEMDEDLNRLKSLLEQGRTTVGGTTVQRDNS